MAAVPRDAERRMETMLVCNNGVSRHQGPTMPAIAGHTILARTATQESPS
jgi:hypothetical protein